ncbi:phage tail protein [Paracoccus sediminis]|uniref:Phage tail protein n=1 Tax=Paracoccus sediminis TaxID=1214787 RepID=A0A238UL98_9RHOB|nr:tail protein X [Paracoccus sediminis]TBN53147.1 phage tail protein [Paracoccus sediminis]SNR22805.1 P2-like prophage tail protein X [Paracoccus sediminis]
MRRVITRGGDMLDALCKVHLGSEHAITAVLDLNPGLAERGPVYPAGLAILFPDAAPASVRSEIRLWGRT